MIFASQESIVKYTKLGIWSEKTLIDYFKTHVKENPNKLYQNNTKTTGYLSL